MFLQIKLLKQCLIHLILISYIHKRVHPLTQHCPGNCMKDRATNFGVEVGFGALTAIEIGFVNVPSFTPRGPGECKKMFLAITWLQIMPQRTNCR